MLIQQNHVPSLSHPILKAPEDPGSCLPAWERFREEEVLFWFGLGGKWETKIRNIEEHGWPWKGTMQ